MIVKLQSQRNAVLYQELPGWSLARIVVIIPFPSAALNSSLIC